MEVVNDIVDPDTVSAEKLFSSRACVWPQSGGMRLIVSYKSQDYTFPLAPPCIVSQTSVELVGKNAHM